MEQNKKYFQSLLKDHAWKAPAIFGGVCLLLLILLDSFLFALGIALLKLGLFVLGIALLGYAIFLAYPTLLQKYKDTRKMR